MEKAMEIKWKLGYTGWTRGIPSLRVVKGFAIRLAYDKMQNAEDLQSILGGSAGLCDWVQK